MSSRFGEICIDSHDASTSARAMKAGSYWPIRPALGQEPLSIGPAAQDTVGGWLPDDMTLSPFDVENPVVGWLDRELLEAAQEAARQARAEGIDIRINSGWRSKGFQERLFADGVNRYGSIHAARDLVASPQGRNTSSAKPWTSRRSRPTGG